MSGSKLSNGQLMIFRRRRIGLLEGLGYDNTREKCPTFGLFGGENGVRLNGNIEQRNSNIKEVNNHYLFRITSITVSLSTRPPPFIKNSEMYFSSGTWPL